jgi:hypothetical protein
MPPLFHVKHWSEMGQNHQMARFPQLSLILILLVGSPAAAETVGQYDNWKLVQQTNEVSLVRRHFLATSDESGTASLAFTCSSKDGGDAILIDASSFKGLPFGQRFAVSARVSGDVPYEIYGLADGSGKFAVLRATEPASFAWLLALGLRGGKLGVAVGPEKWFFSTDALKAALESFEKACVAARR